MPVPRRNPVTLAVSSLCVPPCAAIAFWAAGRFGRRWHAIAALSLCPFFSVALSLTRDLFFPPRRSQQAGQRRDTRSGNKRTGQRKSVRRAQAPLAASTYPFYTSSSATARQRTSRHRQNHH